MIVTLYMCGPKGEVMRRQLAGVLNQLKRDNRYVIQAMLRDGSEVPDNVIEADLNYVPSQHKTDPETGEPLLQFYGMKQMFDRGEFSCGDAAAFEAAVLEEKYGIPTECLSVALADSDYHGVYVTPEGAVDPVERWLDYWEAVLTLTPGQEPPQLEKPKVQRKKQALGASCQIVDGRVVCDALEADSWCCVDIKRKRWRCSDPAINGKKVQIEEVFQGQDTNQRWARTKDGVFVPVCTKEKWRHRSAA